MEQRDVQVEWSGVEVSSVRGVQAGRRCWWQSAHQPPPSTAPGLILLAWVILVRVEVYTASTFLLPVVHKRRESSDGGYGLDPLHLFCVGG